MRLTKSDYTSRLSQIRNQMSSQLGELKTQQEQARKQVSELVSRAETALTELVQTLLPDLSPQHLENVSRTVGYTRFSVANPADQLANAQFGLQKQISDRQSQIDVRRADLEKTPEFQNRLLLRAPITGTLVREIAELTYFREPFAETLRRGEHPRMQRLLDVAYGTANYAVPFWRLSYYSDWKAADEIVAKFEPGKTFTQIREEYLGARTSVDTYDRKLAHLNGEVARGEAIEKEFLSLGEEKQQFGKNTHPLQTQLQRMPEQFLKEAQIQLERYLSDLDFADVGEVLEKNPKISLLAKRYYGLRKQEDYLRQVSTQLLANGRTSLEQSLGRMERSFRKLNANKVMSYESEDLDKYTVRSTRVQEFSQRYVLASTAIAGFAGYGLGKLSSDFLWWDLITDGKVKANFIDEVARFKALHPDYKYRRPKNQPGDEDMGYGYEEEDAIVAVIDTVDLVDHVTDIS